MQIHVTLYGGARVVTGKSEVDLSFDASCVTLAQLLEQLTVTYPRARPYLLDTSGALHTSIRVLLNNERLPADEALTAILHHEDCVTLLVAVAGG